MNWQIPASSPRLTSPSPPPQVCEVLGADGLIYQSLEDLVAVGALVQGEGGGTAWWEQGARVQGIEPACRGWPTADGRGGGTYLPCDKGRVGGPALRPAPAGPPPQNNGGPLCRPLRQAIG